jgi:hypothetical protein
MEMLAKKNTQKLQLDHFWEAIGMSLFLSRGSMAWTLSVLSNVIMVFIGKRVSSRRVPDKRLLLLKTSKLQGPSLIIALPCNVAYG